MKKILIFIGMIGLLFLSSCDTKQPVDTTNSTPTETTNNDIPKDNSNVDDQDKSSEKDSSLPDDYNDDTEWGGKVF